MPTVEELERRVNDLETTVKDQSNMLNNVFAEINSQVSMIASHLRKEISKEVRQDLNDGSQFSQ